MVKKLIKHEFIYYFRTLGMFLPILLAMGVMTKVFTLFDNGNIFGEMISSFAFFMLWLGVMALILLSTVVSVVRFYKNMYSAEGYLTFTLPVSNTVHIFVKLLVALAWQTICFFTIVAVMSLTTSFEVFGDVIDLYANLFSMIFSTCGITNLVLFVIESVLMFFLSSAFSMLLFYACISLGQRAKKNRVLMSVVAYFVYYSITQAISTVFLIVLVTLGASGLFNGIIEWITVNYVPAIHIGLITIIAIFTAMSALFWFITQNTMNKKLNLE